MILNPKILLLTTLLSSSLFAQFNASISKITPEVKKRMIKGDSWRKGCPVSLSGLRYLEVSHLNFYGDTVTGEIIVHKDVADDIVEIFEELYNMNYAINQMKLVSDFKGNDWESIEADNTSAFNCRKATGSKKWSKHSYGKAIDINPLENPYISKKGHISHKVSKKYRKRVHKNINDFQDRAVLLKHDPATETFINHGWTWGGSWNTIKDYQHFSKK
jgi:poly-gamma-glutamate synthesis protein (capsule biosynthesis protein)